MSASARGPRKSTKVRRCTKQSNSCMDVTEWPQNVEKRHHFGYYTNKALFILNFGVLAVLYFDWSRFHRKVPLLNMFCILSGYRLTILIPNAINYGNGPDTLQRSIFS